MIERVEEVRREMLAPGPGVDVVVEVERRRRARRSRARPCPRRAGTRCRAPTAAGTARSALMAIRNACRATRRQPAAARAVASTSTRPRSRRRAVMRSPPQSRGEVEMIGPTEMTSSTTAIAEPKPTRLASPMMLLVTSTDRSSRPLRPRLMMYARSNARSDSMTVMTRIDDVDRAQHREDDPEERLALVGAVDLRRPRAALGSTRLQPARYRTIT